MESLLDSARLVELSAAMFFTGEQRLTDSLAPPLAERTLRLLNLHGYPNEISAKMKPWAAYLSLSTPPTKSGLLLDIELLKRAQAEGMPTYGIESVQEQVAIFADLSEAEHVALLQDVVCHYAEFQRDLAELKTLYLQRDLGGLLALSSKYQMSDTPRYQRLLDVLLWKRNIRMAERLIPRLAEGGAFIAVGALHLAGERGLLALLEARGFTITKLY
jgi:uncharacterized protein YbaP (TraB family)